MNEREFIDETFHMLAQPVTALRAKVELGLMQELDANASHHLLGDCLNLLDRLMQDVAVFREFATLDEAPTLGPRPGHTLLQSCVEEMAIVAEASGIQISLSTEPLVLNCNEPSFRRALFVLLDDIIACSAEGDMITLKLRNCDDSARLEISPAMPPGQRRKLCHKLLQFAGGSEICFNARNTMVTFRESSYRQYQAITFVDKQLLTSN